MNLTADILIVGLESVSGKFIPILLKHDFENWTLKEQNDLLKAMEERQSYNFSNTTKRVKEAYEEIIEMASKELDDELTKRVQNYQSNIKG